MARRKINFSPTEVTNDTKVVDLQPDASGMWATPANGGSPVYLTKEKMKTTKATAYPEYVANQCNIIKASVKTDYLKNEYSLMKDFFESFEDNFDPQLNEHGESLDDPDYLYFKNFPLPDNYKDRYGKIRPWPKDGFELIIIINDYPNHGPYGLHLRTTDRCYEDLKECLDGHILSEPYDSEYRNIVSQLTKKGWSWICYHYENDRWDFNRQDIKAGDCLTKYIYSVWCDLHGCQHGR